MTNSIETPYVGPRTYEERDSRFFFGREREARELLSLVISEPLVLFYAQSGAGKSSLINTRLVPSLREEGFEVLPIGRLSGELPEGIDEVGNIFVYNLLLSLDQDCRQLEQWAHTSLSDYLSSHKSTMPTPQGESAGERQADDDHAQLPRVLIIDQFEEILTTQLGRWRDRQDFFRQLRQAMSHDPLLWVVLTLREDHVAALDPYARLLPGRLRARFHMQRMGHQAALEAVKKPAEAFGRPFAQGVAETLVDNLRQIRVQGKAEPELGEFVEPVQLQVVCYQLWENLKGRPSAEITAQDLEQLGDVDMALAEYYEQAIAKVLDKTGGSEIHLRNWFERELITVAGTRGTVYRGPDETAGLANQTVELLANQYLLRAEIRAGGTWYELVHDRFINPILKANLAWRLGQSGLVQSALSWDAAGRNEDNLYRGGRLKAALAGVSGQKLEPLVEEFLAASQKFNQALEEKEAQRQRELEAARALAEEQQKRAEAEQQRAEEQAKATRRFRRLTIALGVVFVLAVLAAVFARSQQQRAQEQEQIAQSQAATAIAAKGVAEVAALARATAQAQAEVRRVEADAARAEAEAEREAIRRQSRTVLAQGLATESGRLVERPPRDTELATLLLVEALRLNRAGEDNPQVQQAIGNALRTVLATPYYSVILTGFEARVNQVAVSPDGSTLASGDEDGTIRVWNLRDLGAEPTLLTAHTGAVNSVAYSPDGLALVSGGEDGATLLWDLSDPTATAERLVGRHDAAINSVAFSPDGLSLASGSEDGAILWWDLSDSAAPERLVGRHDAAVTSVAFSPDGLSLASGSADQTIHLWDLRDAGAPPTTLSGHVSKVNAIAFSPDGLSLASGGDDGNILLWDLRDLTAPVSRSVGRLDGLVLSVAFSPDGLSLASGNTDLVIRLWDLTDPEAPPDLLSGHKDTVSSVTFSPDGQALASGSYDQTIRLWRLGPSEAVPPPLVGHTDQVRSVAFSPDGQSLASAGNDQAILLWDLANLSVAPTRLSGHKGDIRSVAFSPDGKTLASGSFDRTVRLWDWRDPAAPAVLLTGHQDRVRAVAFNHDGSLLASGSDDRTIRLWDPRAPDASSTPLTGHEARINSVAFSPDGSLLASGSDDQTVRLWDVRHPDEPPVQLAGHEDRVNSVAFSPDGLTLASGSDDQTVRIWDLRSPNAPPTLLPSLDAKILSLAFSPDGHMLAGGGDDQVIRLWDMHDPSATPTLLAGHRDWVSSVAFSPDGEALASGSLDTTVRLWVARLDTLVDIGCRQVHRNLTPDEWQQYVIDEPYHQTCPDWPLPPGAAGELGSASNQ